MFDLEGLHQAAALVHETMGPTPAHHWPLLSARSGALVHVKHENHTPTGAFKLRGGLVYIDHLTRTAPDIKGIVSATRGNHGQSLALAGGRAGLKVTIVVPIGNSVEKNAAMRAFGAQVIESGRDFDAALETASVLAKDNGWHMVPAFHPDLVRGVATYALEFFEAVPDLDTVYVPIGLGSGICGLIRTRDLLGLKTEIVGVVAAAADAYAQSFEAGHPVTTESAMTIADGMACRVPREDALTIIHQGAARVVRVEEHEIRMAVRAYHEDTHNLAEGAGAAPLAALLKEKERQAGRKIGLVLTGGNIDRAVYAGLIA
ncbi:threonine dehydratase [Beijerinckia mobilis]|uniref:threonine dehydratase n=1 Tax=Beijerinckia mobilis TaxID=231434 RepID=UPI000556A912|nr:threonine dehydratase [Beijerinckia mobilis]